MPRKKKAKEEEVFHVEVITKARVSEESKWEYLVKWAGYDSDADSWEPAENVQQCDRLLESFWRHVGIDNKDYPIGYETEADESWINKEKIFFAKTFTKPSKPKSDKAKKKERLRSKSSISESSVEGSQDSDEEPLANPIKKPNKLTRVVASESESGSDNQVRKPARSKATAPPPKELPKAPVPAKRQASMAGGSLPVALPKAPVIRTHQDQRANPLVKSIDIRSKNAEAGSLLSTKQRIAAGIPPPPTGPKPLPLAPKTSLSSLSFKKNKPPVLPSVHTKDAAGPSASVVTPASPVAPPTNIVHNEDVVASPQPMDVDLPFDLFDSVLDDAGPAIKSPEIPTATIPRKSQSELNAEEFLRTVNIPALGAPLEMDVVTDNPEQPAVELSKVPAIPKIPKKWRWSGDLLISTSESKTERLCTINIADPSGTSNSAHINLLLSKLNSLQISRLYLISDLIPLLRACGKPQYFGRLESDEPGEEVITEGLEHHLKNERLAAIIPLLHDGTEAAVLVIFPTVEQGLTKVLQAPDHLLSGTTLLVVLLPYLVSTMASTKAIGWRSVEAVQESLCSLRDITHELSHDAAVHQAMSLLCFPKTLLDFLNNSSTSRSYCVWPLPGQLLPGLETVLLLHILKSTKAVPAKVEEDVRVIFISNRHLDTLHTMPSLATKRLDSPEVQFWTYGYSPDTTNERWRVQEIYPLGGIVTFTTSAIVEDLVGCHHIMSQLVEHPLWDCYLIPEVLAACHHLCSNGDYSSLDQSPMDSILDLIDSESIAVMRMPERGQSNQLAWLSQTVHPSTASAHKLLEFHLGIFKKQTSGMTAEQLTVFTNNEISKDLLRAQVQPAFMKNYRRFIVIRANSEDSIPFDKDGLEWTSLSQFSFKDDYFET